MLWAGPARRGVARDVPGPAPREAVAGGPEVRAQGRVPEVKGPCWWVTRGEVPGERRIPKSGSARSPRVSEVAGGRGSPIRLSGPRPAPPNQPAATGRAAGGLAPDRPGISLRGRSVAPHQPPEASWGPQAGLPQLWGLPTPTRPSPSPSGSGLELGTRQGSAAHSPRHLVVTAVA